MRDMSLGKSIFRQTASDGQDEFVLAGRGGSNMHRVRHSKLNAFLLRAQNFPAPGSASAPGMIRTCDQRFRKPLLYPLSYEGKEFILSLFATEFSGR